MSANSDFATTIQGFAPVWWTGKRNHIDMMRTVQNQALRHITAAFRTTPIRALELEACIPPWNTRSTSRPIRGTPPQTRTPEPGNTKITERVARRRTPGGSTASSTPQTSQLKPKNRAEDNAVAETGQINIPSRERRKAYTLTTLLAVLRASWNDEQQALPFAEASYFVMIATLERGTAMRLTASLDDVFEVLHVWSLRFFTDLA
ncbi:hypothetical protein R3P38DRAFT_3227028 [Favolaschia claudopus]|uniref:Uncharacterized protein n=1 Tax=Favolaschia claudopus TaxID=2862362 RepID=A0AAV9ZTF8_9AGAR